MVEKLDLSTEEVLQHLVKHGWSVAKFLASKTAFVAVGCGVFGFREV